MTQVLRKTFNTFIIVAFGSPAGGTDAKAANKKEIGYVWE